MPSNKDSPDVLDFLREDQVEKPVVVFIAGSGPLGSTFARKILENYDNPELRVVMVDVGSQDDPVVGRHHKNSIKYQKDIDAFVNVIKGALQPVSVPPASSYMSTLGSGAWTANPGEEKLVSSFYNPDQTPALNLPGCAITRTVGGMATHWTCACPKPHPEEREHTPLPNELEGLLEQAKVLLNVNDNEFNESIRHSIVKGVLKDDFPKQGVTNLPLAVKRNENKDYVTWSGANTVLNKPEDPDKGEEAVDYSKDTRLHLLPEHKFIGFVREGIAPPNPNKPSKGNKGGNDKQLRRGTGRIVNAYIKDVRNDHYYAVKAEYYIVACGAVATPQVLWNSGFGEHDDRPETAWELPALGRYLAEQSISFCQIVLKREYIMGIQKNNHISKELKAKSAKHREDFPEDPIPIPFLDPEPQVTIPYSSEKPWHTQIHRDAFSYGDVGPRADPRVIVDLRFFGRQECHPENRVYFSNEHTDIYGMPQATFHVTRNDVDARHDQDMMAEMCYVASKLGPYLPGSYPQFMAPGLALHITGTTRLMREDSEGKHLKESVANENSQVHGHPDLYVAGNNVIPDSTACNPTRTSVAYALHACEDILAKLKKDHPVSA